MLITGIMTTQRDAQLRDTLDDSTKLSISSFKIAGLMHRKALILLALVIFVERNAIIRQNCQ